MADTIRKTEQQKKEHFDSKQVLDEKVKLIANLILNSKHFIAFTGAGISTSCGIPDFRSGANTVLKTGAGVWQKRALGITQTNKNIVDSKCALPSFTHMSLVALERAKLLKFLVSQNTDGLHLRSGFNPANFTQLHGNRMLEKCKKCKSKFLRDFRTRQASKVHDHETSRKCEKCNSVLYDSIINFGQNLPEYELNKSFDEAEKADICLAMGSSLTVTPAADIPKLVGKNSKLIIVNLQETPLDKYAYIRVNALCDDFMKLLMHELNIKVQPFILERLLQFKINKDEEIQFRGIDRRGIPFSYLKQVDIAYNEEQVYKQLPNKQPYRVSLKKCNSLRLKLNFYGWLKQPSIQLRLDKEKKGVVELLYDPLVQKWEQPVWIQDYKFEKYEG